jgi:hypothetical protein
MGVMWLWVEAILMRLVFGGCLVGVGWEAYWDSGFRV